MDRYLLIQILAIVALMGVAAHARVRPRRPSDGDPRRTVARTMPPGGITAGARKADAAWCELLRVEQARHLRHGHPATVVAMHLGRPSGAIARRTLQRRTQNLSFARRIEGVVRATDCVRAGADGVIRVLLTETDEGGGRACVDRVAATLSVWEATAGTTPSLTAAWAGTGTDRDLWAANRLAVARLRGTSAGWLRSRAAHREQATSRRARPPV